MTDTLNLEQALQQLEAIVTQLEAGEGSLDEAVKLFEQGQQLVKQCHQDLDAKALRIQQIMDDNTLTDFEG